MIKEGDFVNIFWENTQVELNVKVLYVPHTTGDCWHLLRENGTVIYVQNFSKMEKLNNV